MGMRYDHQHARAEVLCDKHNLERSTAASSRVSEAAIAESGNKVCSNACSCMQVHVCKCAVLAPQRRGAECCRLSVAASTSISDPRGKLEGPSFGDRGLL